MVSTYAVLSAAIALAGGFSTAAAQACFDVALGPVGDCYIDPRAVEKFQAYLKVVDTDVSCSSGGTFDLSMNYTDINNINRVAQAITPDEVADNTPGMNTLDFNVRLVDILADSPVTLQLSAYNSDLSSAYQTSIVYTQHQTSSILYTTSTSAVNVYTTVASPVTSVRTATKYTTVTPKLLRTSTIKTDTATVTSQPWSTITNTITPSKATITLWKNAMSTSTYSCDPLNTGLPPNRVKRNFFDATNSAPICAAPKTTTITTAVKTTTNTVTVTDVPTALSVVNTLKIVTAVIPKTKYVGATTTITSALPTSTVTLFTKKARATTQITSTRTTVKWVKPSGIANGACVLAPNYAGSSVAAISTAIAQ